MFCGRQAIDGDTAQVGPAIAEHLTIPHAAWVAEIVDVNEKAIQVRQDLVSVSQISEIPYPCLLTIDKIPVYRVCVLSAKKQPQTVRSVS